MNSNIFTDLVFPNTVQASNSPAESTRSFRPTGSAVANQPSYTQQPLPQQTLAGESIHIGATPGLQHRPGLREIMAGDRNKRLLFAASVSSQPHYLLDTTDEIDWRALHASEARALPLAGPNDTVATVATFQKDYLDWLSSLGLGPGKVLEFNSPGARASIAELLASSHRSARFKDFVLAPYYSGVNERRAASAFGMDLFGCDEKLAEKYFNKKSFKDECIKLGIPMVEGLSCGLEDASDSQQLAQIVTRLLKSYPKLMLRGSEGANGSSLAMVEESSITESLKEICDSGALEVLIEPYLSVIASPNDQWIISKSGEIFHLGTSVQLFSNLRHRGNESSAFLQEDFQRYIQQTSSLIVQQMKEDGFCGIVGIDYIVTHKNEIYPIENNPRLNGSTFVYGILDRLKESFGEKTDTRTFTWKFYRAISRPQTFRDLQNEMKDLLFDGHSLNGVFPFDCELLPHTGKWTPVIFAEDKYHLERFEQELLRRGAVAML